MDEPRIFPRVTFNDYRKMMGVTDKPTGRKEIKDACTDVRMEDITLYDDSHGMRKRVKVEVRR